MPTVTLYQSSDASAPVLLNNSTTNPIADVLNACLVTGYGSKAPAGWSAPYTGSGITVFKQGASSNGMYLRVAPTTGFSAGQYGSFVTGAPTATGTALANLTNPFPTTTQNSPGALIWLHGASSPTATVASWRVVADSSFVHLELQTNMTNGNYRQHYMFGDLLPTIAGASDPTGTILIGISGSNPTSTNNYTGFNYTTGVRFPYSNTGAIAGAYIASGYNQQTGSVYFGYNGNQFVSTSSWARSGMMFPNGIDGGFYMSPVYGFDYGASGSAYTNFRGYIPGLWIPCHDRAVDDLVQFAGTGPLNGLNFISILPGGAGQDTRGCAIQTSNWR